MKKLILNVVMMMAVSLIVKGENGTFLKDRSKGKSQSGNELAVESIGQKDGYIFLKLSATKGDDKIARLSINDGEGTQLFSESFSIGMHSRIIKVSPDEISNIEILFRSTSGNLLKRYAIHTSRIQTYRIEELSAQ